MKGLFKSKPKTPAEIVRLTRELLIYLDNSSSTSSTTPRDTKRDDKMVELSKNIRELKCILYGNSESEPVPEACSQLTQEFFKGNTLRLLIICLPKLNLEARKDATQVVANLQRQQVQSRLIASDYLEANKDLMDILVLGGLSTPEDIRYARAEHDLDGATLVDCWSTFFLKRSDFQYLLKEFSQSSYEECMGREGFVSAIKLHGHVLPCTCQGFFFSGLSTPEDIRYARAEHDLDGATLVDCWSTFFLKRSDFQYLLKEFSYENADLALHYGTMLRECIRHQSIARYVLESEHMKKFFDFIQLPKFDIASDATATFKELMTRHKSTVAEFLTKNYDWFFPEFNSQLLESPNYITRRQAIKLLGDILLDRSNSAVMMRYVSSKGNLQILMNLLRENSKNIQLEAFHVFKLFAANQHKPPEIVGILVTNRGKLLRFLGGFTIDKEDEKFEADKAQVINEIAALKPLE